MDISYSRPRKPMPETTDGKLEDIIRRLGRVEMHLIDIKEGRPGRVTEPKPEPSAPKTTYDPPEF
jgi:hypothetical protein